MKRPLFAIALSVVIAGACTESETTGDPADRLTLDEQEGVATGTLETADGPIRFEARQFDATTVEVAYELNGLTFTYLGDRATGVIEMDGFATATGADTQFTADDRAAMLRLSHAMDTLGEVSPLVGLARQVASGMAEFPDSRDLRSEILADVDHDWTSICWAVNSYQATSHDDWNYDWWDDESTLDYAYVSMHSAGPCSDGTYFWKNGSWQCYEPDHDPNVEYAYGNCFGRCGASCGSSTQFTWDCLDHDECVRVGHDTASIWCDDEFGSTTDDWLYAPNC